LVVVPGLPIDAAKGHRSTSAVAKASNRRRSGIGGDCTVKDGARTSERLASCHVYRRSVGAGQRLLIATPDCKSTRRAAKA